LNYATALSATDVSIGLRDSNTF